MSAETSYENARYSSALELAKLLNAAPRESHAGQLAAMLDCAEVIRSSIVQAKRTIRNRVRDAKARGAEDAQAGWQLLIEIATLVTLGGQCEERERRKGARNDNVRLRKLTSKQLDNIARAADRGLVEGFDVLNKGTNDPDIDVRWVSGHIATLTAAIEAYQLEHGQCDALVRFGVLAGTIGEGKQRSAPQVAMLALAHCGYSNAEIARILDRDPAEVRRLVRPARVS